jgi:hypothetical protein
MREPEDQTEPTIEVELEVLGRLPIAQLRERWRAIFRKGPPPAFGPDLLRRRIAYHIQEQAYGGLNPSARRVLDRLVNSVAKTSTGRIQLPRRIKSGSVLIREWKGKTYRAIVTNDGYIYEGENYKTLSEIARMITGTRWNGPRFFGLRKQNEDSSPKRDPSGSEDMAAAL